jgi:hypothetical protein
MSTSETSKILITTSEEKEKEGKIIKDIRHNYNLQDYSDKEKIINFFENKQKDKIKAMKITKLNTVHQNSESEKEISQTNTANNTISNIDSKLSLEKASNNIIKEGKYLI